jgi:hypothetical protein
MCLNISIECLSIENNKLYIFEYSNIGHGDGVTRKSFSKIEYLEDKGMFVYIYMYIYICMYIYIYMCVYIYTHLGKVLLGLSICKIRVHMYTYIFVYTSTYINI